MRLLKPLPTEASYLKFGAQGFQGSGKTFTSALLAAATHRHFKLDTPVAFFDTETGSDYVAPLLKELTGQDALRVKSQRFDDLIEVTREVEKEGIQVLIVDSMTHLWRELCESHLRAVNKALAAKGWRPRATLEFQDWGPIKEKFNQWTRWYLASRVHVLICGRAGYEYDYDKDESGRKQLVKVGIKMKTEGEFGFEPSLLVQMEQEQDLTGERPLLLQRATVLKDRFDAIMGATGVLGTGKKDTLEHKLGRTWQFFEPHVSRLNPAAHTPLTTEPGTRTNVDEAGRDEKKVQRDILLEKIENALTSVFPASTGRDRSCKIACLMRCFGTSSWTEISTRRTTTQLSDGLDKLEALVLLCAKAIREDIPIEEVLGETVRGKAA